MKNFALMSAIALTSAVGFTACSSSDDVIENGPNVNQDKATVKTAITMNIGRGGQTRMASAVTQTNNQAFRGMYSIYIYPANILSGQAWAPITTGSEISAPVVSNEVLATSSITSSASNKTYSGVQVPIGTNNFLFYGRAGSAAPATPETKSSNGFTVPTFPTTNGTTAGVTFTAQQIADPTTSGWTAPADVLINYLNEIKNAFGTTTLSNAAFEALRLDFMKPNTPRAGSAEAVLATANHMYTKINALDGLNDADATIKTDVLNAIKAAPASLSNSTILWATSGTPILTETTFPANLGLPLGAAQYKYDSGTSAFVYITDAHSVAQTPLVDYVYPSEIFYFTNTPLRETANNVTWHTTTADWAAETYASGWGDAVKASSKNIALVNNVQYGTALLATQVKCTPDASNKLYDNSAELDPTTTNNKAIPYAENMFPLTGVLIGAQPSAMGWNFLPLPTGTFTKCIYDKNVSWYDASEGTPANREKTIYANATGESYSSPNYTLVYDNNGYDNDDNASTPAFVNICLEFTNNSAVDFYGKDGLIKVGQKFYLIGKLDLTSKDKPTTFPLNVGSDGAIYYPSVDLRVFIQDYTTTAQCNITAGSADTKGSLANALSCIPDMKAVTQEIGLSIDLIWTPGLTFNVNLGE